MSDKKNLLEFDPTTTANSADWIHISQGGVDKKINLADFISELNGGNPFNITVKEESGSNRILTLSDKNAYIRCLNGVQTTIQVKNAATVGWKVGDSIVFRKEGLGNVLVAGDSGVTIRPSSSGSSLTEPGQAGQLVCVDDTPTATIFDFLTGGNARASVTGSVTFLTVAGMVAGTTNDGLVVDFAELAANNSLVETIYNNTTSKKGGAKYIIKTAAQVSADGDVIDDYGHHWLLGGTDYAAVLSQEAPYNPFVFGAVGDGVSDDYAAIVAASNFGEVLLTSNYAIKTNCTINNYVFSSGGSILIDAGITVDMYNEQAPFSMFGGVANDASAASSNSQYIAAALRSLNVVSFDGDDYYFDDHIVIDDGEGLLGFPSVSYRENPESQTRLLFTNDTDGITYNGGASYRNMIKDLKIQSNLAIGTPTGTGINFTANGGGSTTRALANIIENVTVQNFEDGVALNSAGDFAWFQDIKNLKIFRCLRHLIIDGSNGASTIDGLHIDASAGYSGNLQGVVFNNGNGVIINNYSIEKCDDGLVFNGNEDNDRLYMSNGYFENNKVQDIQFTSTAKGQLYSDKVRIAYFNDTVKNQAIRGEAGADVTAVFRDITFRGDQTAADELVRLTRVESSSTRIWFDGLLLQQACPIWQDFGSGKSPVYIRMLNQDQNSNWVELHRDVITPTRMFAETKRVSSVAPTTSTFVFDLPGGETLDLKYTGANVRGLVAGAWKEWVWNGAAFQETP